MNDRVKSWSDFIEEVIRNFPEVQREIQLEKIKELEYRLAKLKRRAIKCGRVGEAAELSVCEAMATIIKKSYREGKRMRFKNFKITARVEKKSWDELANMIFDLEIERKELQDKLEQAEEWKGYWFSRCEELKKALEDLRNESVSVLRETDKVGENQGR